MNQYRNVVLCLLTLTAGCFADAPIEDVSEPTPEPAAEFEWGQDGDDGEGDPVELGAVPARTSEFEGSPCGDATIDILTVAPNHTITFCGTEDSAITTLEVAPIGHPAIVPEDPGCAANLYAQLAPGAKIPSVLVASCNDDELRQSVAPLSLDHLPQDGGADLEAYQRYCSGGSTRFRDERCYYGGNSNICRSSAVSWHQRTCKPSVGDWCRASNHTIASCAGSTRMLGLEKKRGRSSFSTFYDLDVHSGYWAAHNIHAASKPGIFGWYDWDFRLIGTSLSSAYHRYAVKFTKN